MESKGKESSKDQCIIHYKTVSIEGDDHLVSPQSYDSWLTLLEAAEVRGHSPILEIAKRLEENEVPKIYYHRKCRSLFTMKRDLETLKRKADESLAEAGSNVCRSKRPCRRSSSEARVYDQICIFCSKDKYQKGSKSREKLIQAVQLRADQTLRKCATQKGDENILAVTSRDIVAAEAHYHISCYKNYTRDSTKTPEYKDESNEENETEGGELYQEIEREAYTNLLEYIRTDIIPSKKIVPMTYLTSKLESFILSGGVERMTDSTRKHIRMRLESELESSIDIFPNDKGKLLVVPGSVSLKDVVLENQTLQRELRVWKAKSTNVNVLIDQTSSMIRSAIQQDMTPTPWPYHPSDVKNAGHIFIPNHLKRFLVGVITGDPDNKNQTQRITTLVQSFSQDIIYAVTRGKHKPPKHLLLPYAVKTLTGNVEIIRTLNNLGHGVSYSQLEENDTALCLQKLAANLNQRVVLPASIKPHVFTNLAWDNIDRLEEALTGKGTSHRVNGIAVQAKVYGPHLPRGEFPRIEKLKQRSINVEYQELAVYVAGTRVGPQPLPTKENHLQEAKKAAQPACIKNLIWILARQANSECQTIPGWTGFNIRTRDQVSVSEDVVEYLPTINAPATELTTVFEILNQSELIRRELYLQTIVVVMDQALFAKAVEITWKHKERFSNTLLRMGTFHTICNALSILGKRFGDGGLKDICIEAELVAEGSIKGVVDGKQYNRAVRVHKYIYEALMRLAWAGFTHWVEENFPERNAMIKSFLEKVNRMVWELNQKQLSNLLQSSDLAGIMSLWGDFLEHLRHSNGQLSAYWMSYIDIVENVVLGLLRAAREGNWDLHLSAIRTLIPWCFAYDKVNYARYLSPYLAQMTNLPEKNPEVYVAFKEGQFSVQLSSNNPFGRLPVDQTTEVTVNKDTQTPGGTARFSLKAASVKRYYLTAEHHSAFLGRLRELVQGNKTEELHHAELQRPRIQKEEKAVLAVVDLIQGWINPFAEKQDLVSISTAKAAPEDITSDLMKAFEIGEQSYAAFKKERLEKDPPAKKFHDTMKTNRLKTFSSMYKKKEVKSKGRAIILKADRSLFGRIVVMAQARSLRMEDILCHPLGPLPWALSTPEGLLRKTNKASLATMLQRNVTTLEQLPENCASVVDGMGLVQRVKGDQATFGDIAATVLFMALNEGGNRNRIDVVFDTYRDNSIKDSERLLRGEESGHQLQAITGMQIVRQWRCFLTRVKNKNSLISFIVSEWMKAGFREKLQQKVLYATVSDKCYRITSDGSNEVQALQCQQEEADGRLLLHAAHAAEEGYEGVVVCSEDTDVFIMALAFHDKIGSSLFQKFGTRTRTRVADIRKVAATLGIDVCRALIGMHSFTGCDTVSAFAGKGKTNALKLLTTNRNIQHMFFRLGEEWDLSPQLLNELEAFTCLLYAPKGSAVKVNDLRYNLFCAKKGEIESHQLPPCRDCLEKHAQRANYQAGIWKRCLEQDPQVPSPVGRGWKIETEEGVEQLVVHWMEGQPAPDAVLDLLACTCPKKCTLPKCECMANGLKCTDMCKLPDCDNQPSISDSEESADEDEDEDENELDSDELY